MLKGDARKLTASWLARQGACHREDRAAGLSDHAEPLQAQLISKIRNELCKQQPDAALMTSAHCRLF